MSRDTFTVSVDTTYRQHRDGLEPAVNWNFSVYATPGIKIEPYLARVDVRRT